MRVLSLAPGSWRPPTPAPLRAFHSFTDSTASAQPTGGWTLRCPRNTIRRSMLTGDTDIAGGGRMAWIRARGRAGDGALPSQLRWHAVGARGRRFVGRRSPRTRGLRGVGNSINLSWSNQTTPPKGLWDPTGLVDRHSPAGSCIRSSRCGSQAAQKETVKTIMPYCTRRAGAGTLNIDHISGTHIELVHTVMSPTINSLS